ncbi:MAG: hypothetical protein J0L63_05285 [Anaerolineae bacterium]|nr:hypothetical protein [Anaerolineae bacterium]
MTQVGKNSRRYWRREQAAAARVCVICRREDGNVALLAAGNTVLAAAMRQWQREAGRLPPTETGCRREDGELPQTTAAIAATSAISGRGCWWEMGVSDMANLIRKCV